MEEGIGHIEIYEEFTDDLRASHREQLNEWRRAIRGWEEGEMSSNSPYDLDGEGTSINVCFCRRVVICIHPRCTDVTLAKVTRLLAEEEARNVVERRNIIPGRSAFLLEGVSIENMQ